MAEIAHQEPPSSSERRKTFFNCIIALVIILSITLNIILIIRVTDTKSITGNAVLIDPAKENLLDRNVQNDKTILHYTELSKAIDEEIQAHGSSENFAVFVQDAKTGAWMGRNEKMGFAPASLMKIPIMLAILKKVDRKEISLDDTLIIREEFIDYAYGNARERKAGDRVSIRDLLEGMIRYSDNTAKNALKSELTVYELDEVFQHVGIPNPYTSETEEGEKVSVRAYIRLFKALYYSTFLSEDLSTLGLNLTTNTQVENLISEGVPVDIEVAHKFGIYDDQVSEKKLLHDCGIVYHKENPYFICIMTKNTDIVMSADFIQKVSKHTYDFVNRP